MATQYTTPYNLPYPQIGDPVKEGQAAIEGIANAVNTALVNGSFPASNPDVMDITARLNELEKIKFVEFSKVNDASAPANTLWGPGLFEPLIDTAVSKNYSD